MSRQNTIKEMEAKVKEGLAIARERVTEQHHKDLLDVLEATFERLAGNMLIVATGLVAMKYRSAEQIQAQLDAYLQAIKAGKEIHNQLLFSVGKATGMEN